MAETKNSEGMAVGTGFATPNPWGAYTVYLMATNAKGQRTWRIENYLPQGATAQGSTMYLLEGAERALLVDAGQNTKEEMGKNDLKTIVRHLLGHDRFVVAITHGHGDHTGKVAQMTDRTVYFPDLDWPRTVTPNLVPIKEGGGATPNGPGQAVGQIALGGRTLRVINLYGHTPGSVGLLDVENQMICTSDAIGSGLVWAHFGTITQFADSVRHLRDVLRPLKNPVILPGHFYQINMGARGKPPVNGRMLDKQYVDDMLTVAEGVLKGSITGVAYPAARGGGILVAKFGTAEMTYNPSNLGFPGADITNGVVAAKFYLPDPAKGSYRATRFDWSGIIHSLQFQGHEYFGQWYARHDPLVHDAITGPVEVFDPVTGGPGYAEAAPGGRFVRIGVGVLEKPEEKPFAQFRTYKIVDPGQWQVRQGKGWIEFTHTLAGHYVYTKRVSLPGGKPEMIIAHSLTNKGPKEIRTSQYNHNFFMLDRKPSGPGLKIRFPFEPKAVSSLQGFLEIRGKELVHVKPFEPKQYAQSVIEGFGQTAKDYDIAMEQEATGAGVRITGDRPLSRINFWTIRETSCPEPYIDLRVPPGKTGKWSYRYRFYSLK